VRSVLLAVLVATAFAGVGLACNDIESRRRSSAPLNASTDFPCQRYTDAPPNTVAKDGRCVVDNPVAYGFTIVVHVPESSFYAAGHTFVLTNRDLTVSGADRRAKLPVFGTVIGAYTVTQEVAKREMIGDFFADAQQSIPVRAVYFPLGPNDPTSYDPALPLEVVFARSQRDDNQSPPISYVRSLPAGRWLRSFEPAPPYDAIFPPHLGPVEVKPRTGDQFDLIDVGGANVDFDDLGGDSRTARISRAEGLEGWTVFMREVGTRRRISTLKTLCEGADPKGCADERTAATTRLDTVGRGTAIEGTGEVEAVLAPPPGWIGVPTLVRDLTQGCCLVLPYPELPPPVALDGIVAAGADAGLFLAVASRVTLDSVSINGAGSQTLVYSTTVSTDDRGRFATVVPQGTYNVTVEPLEGTGFASVREQKIIVDDDPSDDPIRRTRITLLPPRRTHVRGAALLTDGRPALNAEVLATAEPGADVTAQPTPRPGRTTVGADGTFALDLDQGRYVLTIVPEAGTGFPRVLTRTQITPGETDVGVVRIPPPTRLGLQVVEPATLARPIPLANVRIFAAPEGGGPLLEIGNGMTNAEGRVEILLAQQPK
jgi:hypothetical protein